MVTGLKIESLRGMIEENIEEKKPSVLSIRVLNRIYCSNSGSVIEYFSGKNPHP